jgi:predicted transcriptional regulator
MRINARLDDETQAQLDYLVLSTGQSVSHVVRESVAHYYAQVKQKQPRPSRLLAMVGAGNSGRSDISSNVKDHLTEILEKKFGLAPSESSLRLQVKPLVHHEAGSTPKKKARAAGAVAGRRKE